MSKKPRLSTYEKGQIMAFRASCWTIAAIARELQRSRGVIASFLKDKRRYNRKNNGGRPRKLTPADERRIIREACSTKMSSTDIVRSLQLTVKPRRVRQVLEKCQFLKYQQLAITPAMRQHHKEKRVEWAKEKMTWPLQKWKNVVWSDERKFNLDGPDGLAYDWQDLRSEKEWFSKRQNGGESVMVWACFAGTKLSELVILEGKQDGIKYIKTLEDDLLPFLEDLPLTSVFMQDGAPCHRARVVKNWLNTQHVSLLEWPAYSPDLNPIENLWGILVRKVYANQRQFLDVHTLIDVIYDCWLSIEPQVLDTLIGSMQNRCVQVVLNKGNKINY